MDRESRFQSRFSPSLVLNIQRGSVFWLFLLLLSLDIVVSFSRESPSAMSTTTTAVSGKIHLDYPMENFTKYNGERLTIRCEITGDPLPTYKWYKDGVQIRMADGDGRIGYKTMLWGSRLKIAPIKSEDAGVWTCQGENRHGQTQTSGTLVVLPGVNPNAARDNKNNNGDLDSKDYDIEPDVPNKDNNDDGINIGGDIWPGLQHPFIDTGPYDASADGGFCQKYNSAACSKVIGNQNIYVNNLYHQGSMEEKLTAVITMIATSKHLSARCGEYAIPSLCYYVFPLCDETTSSKPRPRMICKDECLALQNNFCKDEYEMVQNPSGNPFGLPDCSRLPEMGTPESHNCVRLNIPTQKQKYNPSHYCYNGTGTSYRGHVSKTVSGAQCIPWTSSGIQHAFFNSNDYPELGNHFYCRNPGNREMRPWCFINNQKMELCDIPKCPQPGEEQVNGLLVILVPSIAIPAALALLLVIIIMCRRTKHGSNPNKPVNQANHPMEMSAMLAKTPAKVQEYPIGSIRFLHELGEGSFGKVYKGELMGYVGEKNFAKVAIKTLKENSPQPKQQEFKREIEQNGDLKHPNIMFLLGVNTKDQPLCIMYEYDFHGDLHEFIQMRSPLSDVTITDEDGGGQVLNQTDMIHICQQVASGMEYLATHRIVHKDLATRNVFVADNMVCKISDLGLSKDIYSQDYYKIQQNKPAIPVRWLPPESIIYSKFTTESDVWSFGVLLWEVYSYGLQPYYGYSNQEVIEMIRKRQILPSPEDCPSRIYALMVECWHEMPIRRPSFKELHTRLVQWKAELVVNQHSHMMNVGGTMNTNHSHSGQSSSGHNSGLSHHSHHSSTGPSNNTQTTAVSGQQQYMGPNYMGNQIVNHYNQLNRFPVGHPIPMGGPPPQGGGQNFYPPHYHQATAPRPQYTYPGLYKKPSPPGSTASHKSSSVHSSASPASSVSNYKTTPPGNGSMNYQNHIYNQPQPPQSPTTQNQLNMITAMNKQHPNQNANVYNNEYTPETKTSDI